MFMQNPWNLTQNDMREIDSLTAEQLSAIRRNIQEPNYTDDETREAMGEACADGHDVADFL
jgi:hypothetical protein